jgi:DNA-binding MarR family transcriptional regulator
MCIYTNLPIVRSLSSEQLAGWRSFINAHDRATRAINRDLAAAGLPELRYYDVLWAIRSAGDKRLRVGEVAEHVILSRTGLVRLLERLVERGLLEKQPVPGDRRGAYVALTQEGEQLLREMWPVYRSGIQRYFAQPLGQWMTQLRRLDKVAIEPEVSRS